MTAMNRETGKAIDGREEIEQSIDDILSTPRGDRVMRADWGSDLFLLVDVGMDASGKARIAQATAEAVARHEARVRIARVTSQADAGELTYDVQGEIVGSGAPVVVRRSV